jgi:AcrR family transcriptional regulator
MGRTVGTGEDRRAALVNAAYRQIAAHGFEGLRTRDVAAEVGVNIATLHYYFPTKEKLIEGVVAHAMGRFRTTLESSGASGDLLGSYLKGVRRLLTAEPELGAVMGELALRSARDPALGRILWEMNEAWHKTVRGLLRRAAREGQISRDLDNDGVAAMIVAILSSLSLPRAGVRTSQALMQLEDWLKRPSTPKRSSN